MALWSSRKRQYHSGAIVHLCVPRTEWIEVIIIAVFDYRLIARILHSRIPGLFLSQRSPLSLSLMQTLPLPLVTH